MARRSYETEENLVKEREIADFIQSVWHMSLIKNPKSYRIDFGVMKGGRIRGWVEVKERKINLFTYPTVILSLAKWMQGRRLALETGTRFFFVIQVIDGSILCSEETSATRKVNYGGRRDRNDSEDIEPVVHIPIADFRVLGG